MVVKLIAAFYWLNVVCQLTRNNLTVGTPAILLVSCLLLDSFRMTLIKYLIYFLWNKYYISLKVWMILKTMLFRVWHPIPQSADQSTDLWPIGNRAMKAAGKCVKLHLHKRQVHMWKHPLPPLSLPLPICGAKKVGNCWLRVYSIFNQYWYSEAIIIGWGTAFSKQLSQK